MTAAPTQARGGETTGLAREPRIVLVGAPNAGKTSIFNALTGINAKTGNYPGVTVSRSMGTIETGTGRVVIEDLPGAYSLDPISPDEQIVADVLAGRVASIPAPDAIIAVVDATTLRRSLRLLAQLINTRRPVCVAVTLTDELAQRGGQIEIEGLGRALGVPVVPVIGHRGTGIEALGDLAGTHERWPQAPMDAPIEQDELEAWIASVLDAAHYRAPGGHRITQRVDKVLLHPFWGTVAFIAVMFLFFQVIFTVAAPLQDAITAFFAWLGGRVDALLPAGWLQGLVGDAIIGGVGNVLVFLPQIMLLFLLISLLEGIGYMSRAAFLMDRVMARVGLEGRAFVSLLSSMACAVPGIMSTRTLPSAKDRLATIMAAPLMTCSARLPVYLLLISLLVPADATVGPFGAHGAVMFGLYLLGATSAMLAAWIVKRLTSRSDPLMPFYMEMPPYRMPTLGTTVLAMWSSAKSFLHKAGTIILGTTVVLWLLLTFPQSSTDSMAADGIDVSDDQDIASYQVGHSYAAGIGHAMEPVFAPLGFDWRINVGILSSLSARESFVATLGQVSAAADPEHPEDVLGSITFESGPHVGEPVFSAATVAALLVFFVYALQCMSTVAVMKRETGGWRWPATAFASLFVVAWTMAYLAHEIVGAVVGG